MALLQIQCRAVDGGAAWAPILQRAQKWCDGAAETLDVDEKGIVSLRAVEGDELDSREVTLEEPPYTGLPFIGSQLDLTTGEPMPADQATRPS